MSDDTVSRLRDSLESTQRQRQVAALSELSDVAAADPDLALELVPLVTTFLDDESRSVRRDAVLVLARVAETYPAQVTPAVPQLTEAVEAGDVPVEVMFALGQVASAYPGVARPLVERFVELLDDENHRVRNNALASLADLSNEYAADLCPHVPRFVELLDDDDQRVRYNATSVLARVAKGNPDAVEPAIPRLRELLSVDHAWTRENACWALGYLRAESARSALERLRDDPDESVRRAATYAVSRIRD